MKEKALALLEDSTGEDELIVGDFIKEELRTGGSLINFNREESQQLISLARRPCFDNKTIGFMVYDPKKD